MPALAFARLFLSVIQSRCGEESRAAFYDAPLTEFVAPQTLLWMTQEAAILRSSIAVSLPQSAGRIVSI